MGYYYSSGKAIYYTNSAKSEKIADPVLIADAGDEEKAHSIVTALNQRSPNFIKDALVTCSPMFHGDMVSDIEFRSGVNDCIDALNKLDKIKKSLFYGRDNNLISDGENDVSDLPQNVNSNTAIAINYIHAILGIATEAGELLEQLREVYNGNQPIDWVNVKEEVGDGFWYYALLASDGDFTFEEVMALIIAKLRSRYADKFLAAEANERNLEAERLILEGDPSIDRMEGGSGELGAEEIDGPYDEPTGVISDDMAASLNLKGANELDANKAELESNQAFANLDNVGSDAVEAPVTGGTGDSELSKPISARKNPLPDEKLARQYVRREDVEK